MIDLSNRARKLSIGRCLDIPEFNEAMHTYQSYYVEFFN